MKRNFSVLIFTRPAITEFNNNIFKYTWLKDASFFYVTEYFDELNKIPNSYLLVPNNPYRPVVSKLIFSDAEIYDIILRDRMLSLLPFEKSIQLVTNVTIQLMAIFEIVNPSLVTGHVVDYYTIDIFYRIAIKLNIKTFTMVFGYKGTFKFYDYNRPIERAEPDYRIDVRGYINSGKRNIYSPNYSDRIFYRLRRYYWLKKKQFLIRLKKEEDFQNFNTDIQLFLNGYQALPQLQFRDIRKDFFTNIEDVNSDKIKIFIALHYSPEATMNYFSVDNTLFDHDKLVLEILTRFSDKFTFIIKEHPDMVGLRPIIFYDEIKRIPNCFLLPHNSNTRKVVEFSDIVLSWSGSISWEAPFWDKRTINIMKPPFDLEGVDNYFINYLNLINDFERKVKSLNYDNHSYCEEIEEYFRRTHYFGIPLPDYGDKNNLLLANAIDELTIKVFGL